MIKKFIKDIRGKLARSGKPSQISASMPRAERQVIPRSEHTISREHISEGALKVLQTLRRHNYAGFLVGGSVRDMLLGIQPKDFDIATDATPEELTRLFRNAQIIGRRFRIVHIRFGRETIEVTTFRGHHHDQPFDSAQGARTLSGAEANKAQRNKSGMLLRDNVYGTVEEDAIRRDFTVNALYYNIEDFAVYDYTQGLADIARRQIHIIGDPELRYREDPVRMLRAIRLAAKLDFSIEKNTAEKIPELKQLLASAAAARLFDEVLKLFTAGYAEKTFILLEKYELFGVLFTQTAHALSSQQGDNDPDYQQFLLIAMQHTDERIHGDKRISPAYLFAALLWPAFQKEMKSLMSHKNPPAHYQAQHMAADSVISQLVARITLPKRFSAPMKEIWQLQFRLANRAGSRAEKLFSHPRFRAAYDFVLLREEAGENLDGLGQWWTDYQVADETIRLQMANNVSAPSSSPRKRRNRRGPGNTSR